MPILYKKPFQLLCNSCNINSKFLQACSKRSGNYLVNSSLGLVVGGPDLVELPDDSIKENIG